MYVEKCREIQRNAAVLHHILGAVAHHSLEPRRHSNIPPQPGHHSSQPHAQPYWRHDSSRLCQALSPSPQGSGRDSW